MNDLQNVWVQGGDGGGMVSYCCYIIFGCGDFDFGCLNGGELLFRGNQVELQSICYFVFLGCVCSYFFGFCKYFVDVVYYVECIFRQVVVFIVNNCFE